MSYKEKQLIALSNFAVHKDNLNNSNYINLPESYLKKINKLKHPYYFQLKSPNGLKTYVGVREFSAEEGYVILPHWILDYLGLNGSERIKVKLIKNIPKGKKIVIEPQEKEFFSIPECEGCLETILSNFCLLHKNQTIQIDVLDKKYHLLIKEAEPDWEKIDFDNPPNLVNELIDIKDIDLTVDIKNKFLEEEKINNSFEEKNNTSDNILEEVVEEEEVIKGRKLSDNKTVSRDKLREARLKYFEKKKELDI